MPIAERTVVRLQRVISVAAVALVASTWRLWTPGTEFPQIPWFAWACDIPTFVDWGALAGLLTGCLVLLLAGQASTLRRGGGWLLAGSLVVLFLPSQQRLQPWAYEFLLISLILALSPPRRGVRLLRWLVASIYIHSSLSKVDVTFFDTQGEMLLGGLLEALHMGNEFWTDRATWLAIGLFPLVELVVGIGLLVPAARRCSAIGSFVMHALLLLALGPLGLNHRAGVLIWNMYFIAQNWILFRPAFVPLPATVKTDAEHAPAEQLWRSRVAAVIAAAAIGCPFLQNGGWYDVWPSWAVYSSRTSLVTMQVREERVPDLPEGLQGFVGAPEALTEWRPVNLDSWSFANLNCPIYPEERFRIAVIRTLVENCELADDVRVVVHDPPDRWTGLRDRSEVEGSDALREYSTRYRLNTAPCD